MVYFNNYQQPLITLFLSHFLQKIPNLNSVIIFSDRKKNNADRMIQIATYLSVNKIGLQYLSAEKKILILYYL